MSLDLHYVFPTKAVCSPGSAEASGSTTSIPRAPEKATRTWVQTSSEAWASSRGLKPYLQIKVVVKGDTETVLGFGLRF